MCVGCNRIQIVNFQVLGRNVYSSNSQLGGVQVMFNNGVTHKTEGLYIVLAPLQATIIPDIFS